jgi:hypothetical protein
MLGSLLVVDALGAGPVVLERRARVVQTLTMIVDRGRDEARAGSSSSGAPPLTAEGVVGAVLSVIHARMLEQAASRPGNGSSRPRRPAARTRTTGKSVSGSRLPEGQLLGLLNPLMGMIVLPYLGRAAAARELARLVPPRVPRVGESSRALREPSGDPLEGLNMRLTYRTLRVLAVIGTDPGTSNRQIAEAAGVHDQGQISKLLARLEKLGLIHNSGNGQPRGEPNAWTLTTRGRDIQQIT